MTLLSSAAALFIRRQYYRRSLLGISRVYDNMGEVVNNTSSDRFLIIQLANGGGKPHVGARLYASVLYEYHGTGARSIKNELQNVEVDGGYANVLIRIEQNKALFVRSADMEPSLLRSLFERDGITAAYMFKVAETSRKYYYASVETTSRVGVMDIATIELAASRIKTIFKNAK